eukprot:SAG31_NODE_1252_length_9108_cov_24.066711_11_plen_66_part_00
MTNLRRTSTATTSVEIRGGAHHQPTSLDESTITKYILVHQWNADHIIPLDLPNIFYNSEIIEIIK